MNMNENKKLSSIIAEVSQFLLHHQHSNFSIDVNKTDTHQTIEVKTTTMKEEVLNKFVNKMKRDREEEIETYGWSLITDSDSDNELEIAGLLIDEVEVIKHNGSTVILLKRTLNQKQK